MTRHRHPLPTTRVSDILIEHIFQIECAEHGVIDQVHHWTEALAARRDHYERWHKEPKT